MWLRWRCDDVVTPLLLTLLITLVLQPGRDVGDGAAVPECMFSPDAGPLLVADEARAARTSVDAGHGDLAPPPHTARSPDAGRSCEAM